MEKNLVNELNVLKQKLESIPGKNSRKTKYVKDLNRLITLFSELKIPEEYSEKYQEFIKRAKEFNVGENYRNIKKIEVFLPNCFYFYFEVKKEIRPILLKMSISYVISSILFLIVGFPLFVQTFGPIIGLVFIVPMFIGIRGMSKGIERSVSIGLAVTEMGILTSIISISILFYGCIEIYPKFSKMVMDLYKVSYGTAGIAIIVYGILSLALLIMACYNIVFTYKYKKIFE